MMNVRRIKYKLLAAMLAVAFTVGAQNPAQNPAPQPAAEAAEEDLTMEQALAIPAVPQKKNGFIKDYMHREAVALHRLGYKVETMRKGEIVIATIPTDNLFAPNDTVLMKSASKDLKNFLPYFRTPGKFKVVLAVHTDDTGNDSYLRSLSEKRIVALYDYFDKHAANTELLTGYPMGANDPLTDNANRAARAANRRLEIYILPADRLIEEASTAR